MEFADVKKKVLATSPTIFRYISGFVSYMLVSIKRISVEVLSEILGGGK
jgi:hypothetical protein